MKIAVTGSSGMIASALIPALRADGHEVVGVSHSGRGDARWDPESGAIDQRAIEGAGAVIHLAGANLANGRWTQARRREIRDSRVKSARLLVDTFAKCRRAPEVFISASAVGYYGDSGEKIVDESAPPGTGFLAELCQSWEAEAARAETLGVRVVMLRNGVVLAPQGGALARLLPIFRSGLGGAVGDGRQWVSWVAIDDAVAAIRHALVNDSLAGPCNLASPEPVRNVELAAALGRVLARPVALRVPTSAVKLLWGEKGMETVLVSCRAAPTRLEASGYGFQHPALEPALRHVLRR